MEVFSVKFKEFSILFTRLLTTLSLAPFFGGQSFSYLHRVAITFFIAFIMVPVLDLPDSFHQFLENNYFILLLQQVFIGFFIGTSLQLIFIAFQMAGEFFSIQMGFGINEVLDPLSEWSLPLMGTFKSVIGLFIFFVSYSHLWLIQAVVFSFEKLPHLNFDVMMFNYHQSTIKFLLYFFSGMFVISLKIAMPVMGTLFLVSVTLGILSKAAPQMNILMLGFTLKIFTAFCVLGIMAPIVVELMLSHFDFYFRVIDKFIHTWSSQLH